MFKESIKMSWSNIVRNKMRSFLTVLGVLIGVASIIALISIVEGVTANITGQVMDMGANTVMVQVQGTPYKAGLTENDITSLSEIDNIRSVSVTVQGAGYIANDGVLKEDISIQGKNEHYFNYNDDLLATGRKINYIDVTNSTRVCIIGSDIVEELFQSLNPIGESVIINGIAHTVVGVLAESDSFSSASSNGSVIIPSSTAMGLVGVGYISALDIYLENGEIVDITTKEIESYLMESFNGNEDGYSISNMQSIIDTVDTMTGTMSMLLSGIAAISLLVGGIGIMNMMLVTVTERTKEIGLRKALGATPVAIQIQFVLEALFLSILGGVLGLACGLMIAYVGSLIIGIEFTIVFYAIPLAIGFSAFIGLIFGYMPAKKASKLNPIDALRSM